MTHSDSDSISDWDEVDTRYLKKNSKGEPILPSYMEFLEMRKDVSQYVIRGLDRYLIPTFNIFIGERLALVKLEDILAQRYVLPIKSDPTSPDGDGDGILDVNELNWDGVDVRYKDINPLRKDTIETLYPELTRRDGSNVPDKGAYLEVEDNNVTIHLQVSFTGDAYKNAEDAFAATANATDVNYLAALKTYDTEIRNRLGTEFTFKDVFIDALEQRLTGKYSGDTYDFYKGMQVNFSVVVAEEAGDTWFKDTVEVNIKHGLCGHSHAAYSRWDMNSRIINMYTSSCSHESHTNRPCADINGVAHMVDTGFGAFYQCSVRLHFIRAPRRYTVFHYERGASVRSAVLCNALQDVIDNGFHTCPVAFYGGRRGICSYAAGGCVIPVPTCCVQCCIDSWRQ